MFVESLKIESRSGVLRDIHFDLGLNLIVDETSADDTRQTGNNVGKTTLLKLIDYCLGANMKTIYQDPENTKAFYEKVKIFLEEQNVIVTLVLVDTLKGISQKKVTIRRNFLKGKQALREVNGQQVLAKNFESMLGALLFPQLPEGGKPTFRQVISHNIRYDEHALTHTLDTLDPHTRGVEYEALYLFMLGCPPQGAKEKQSLAEKRKAEMAYVNRLRNGWSLQDYEIALGMIDSQIGQLESTLNCFEDTHSIDLDEVNAVKQHLSSASSSLTQIELKINIIENTQIELASKRSDVDMEELRSLYETVSGFIPDLQKSFEELTAYHNAMVTERIAFITEELPELRKARDGLKMEISALQKQDEVFSREISKVRNGGDYRAKIDELNELYRRKGEYDARITQLRKAQNTLDGIEKELQRLSEESERGGLSKLLAKQVELFNKHFRAVSQELYGEGYALGYELKQDKAGTEYYHFYLFNAINLSSGKKQGEMLCFDMAYTAFADEEGIDCMHFLLNDKKELMHGNQLSRLSEVAVENNVQLIVPILHDKLPLELKSAENVTLCLSQDDKLFRIEKQES